MTVRTVTAADTRFLVREEGSGTGRPVLLLHGVPETSSIWRDVAPALAVGRRVLAPDLPGLGGSAYSGPFDIPSLVRQLAALVEAETAGAAGPVDLVGHDWGGSLALALAGERPDLVARLVVINAPYREVPLVRAAHIPFFALPGVPELLFRLGGRRVVDTMLKIGWKSDPPLDADRRAEYEAAYTDPEKVRAMLAYYRGVARPRLASLVTRGTPPSPPRVQVAESLVLWGALDPVLPISTGESVVRDLGASCVMVTVPGAGHFVVEEAPAVVASVLGDFLHLTEPTPAKAATKTAAKAPTKAPAKKAAAKRPAAKKAAAKRAPAKPVDPAETPVKKAAPAPRTPRKEAPPSSGTP
jgi:haloacetate dehalogenase